MSCKECNFRLWSSVSFDSAARGLNRKAKEAMREGAHRFLRFRFGVDVWDVLENPITGLHPAERSRMGKALDCPSLNGAEIVTLALRPKGYGVKAISALVKSVSPSGISFWLKFHGFPAVSEAAKTRARKDHSARYAVARKQPWHYLLTKLAPLGLFVPWIQSYVVIPRSEFIGPKIPQYWRDIDKSRDEAKERARIRYYKNRNDEVWILSRTIKTRIYHAIRRSHNLKHARTLDLLGCSMPMLRRHLESMFKDGMTWQNHGQWHIDHIRPIASFDLSSHRAQCEAFHYTNLQPLWAIENRTKHSWHQGNHYTHKKRRQPPPARIS
jgi:hypothetical protein